MTNETEVRANGGPKGWANSKSFASVRATRHLLKRSPKTYPSLMPPKRALHCYHETEDGRRIYKYIRCFNPDLGCREHQKFDGDGYLLFILRAYPGRGWGVDWEGYDCPAKTYEIVKAEWDEVEYNLGLPSF